jgi:hypothetical protein
MWLPELDNFKQMTMDHLAKPANSTEMEYCNDFGEVDGANQYIIHVDAGGDWHVFGFIDDMALRTC